jgi:ATP synthase protein I
MSEEQGGKDGSFEERLRAARDRRGMDAPAVEPGSPGSSGATPWGMGLRVGIEMVSALAVAVVIGLALDRWLHTRPAFLAVFVLLGGAAGVLNVWRMFAPGGRFSGSGK